MFQGAGVNSGALIRAHGQQSARIIQRASLLPWTWHGYLDDRLFSDGAGPSLAGVEPLLDREAAAMRLEPLHQQIIYSSEVVVAFVLERLEENREEK